MFDLYCIFWSFDTVILICGFCCCVKEDRKKPSHYFVESIGDPPSEVYGHLKNLLKSHLLLYLCVT